MHSVTKHIGALDELKTEERRLAAELKTLCISHGKKFKEQYPERSAKVLHKLALVYRKYSPDKDSLIRCVGLFNASIVRKPDNLEEVKIGLQELCKHVLKLSNATNQDADLISIANTCKQEAQVLRDKVEKRLSTIGQIPWFSFVTKTKYEVREKRKFENKKVKQMKRLMEDIADVYSMLMHNVSEQCIAIMGPFPCKYAVMGMGSLSRKEITPFSDFEHSILIDSLVDDKPKEEKEEILDYFRWFSVLFHLVITNMGETLLRFMYIPSLNDIDNGEDWFYDAFTPCGISFDGMVSFASIYPRGRQPTKNKPWPTELIKSVPEMLKYLDEDIALENGYHLREVLTKVCFVSGFQDLVEEYTSQMCEKQKIGQELKHPSLTVTAEKYLEEFDIFRANEYYETFLDEDTMSVKEKIYRQFTLGISLLVVHN